MDGPAPAGVLMRTNFYQKIGGQFGYSMFMKRPITLVMKKNMTAVQIDCDVARFGLVAMNRDQDSMYDFIVVLKDGNYAGTVSIREYLIEMSSAKEREIQVLNEQQRLLRLANEAEKQHRVEIEQKNAAIKNLLDHTGQGFLFFGSDLRISEEYSRECDAIFGFSIGNQDILTVLGKYVDGAALHVMQDAFENVFRTGDPVRSKVYLSVMPEEIRIGGRYIRAEYKVIGSEAQKSVMIILTDITEKRALELKSAEEKNNIRLIIRAIGSRSEISEAVGDLRTFCSQGALQILEGSNEPKAALQHIFRLVHTMKGDFSLNSLHHTAEGLHRLEDSLGLMLKNIDGVRMEDLTEFVRPIDSEELLKEDIATITGALGAQYFEKDDTYTVNRQRLAEIEDKVRALLPQDEQAAVLRLLRSLVYTNVKDIMKDYDEYIKTLGERFGKLICDMRMLGDDVYIDRDRYAPFVKSLVHVFRNMADHGIEDPEERLDLGKPEYGEVSCKLEKLKDQFVLSLSDDGRGIDVEAVRSKAVEKGIYTAEEAARLSKEKVLATILMDGFSTRNTVDMYSGRGVGMAAVYSELTALGGQMQIDSEVGKYTRFTFIVPLRQE